MAGDPHLQDRDRHPRAYPHHSLRAEGVFPTRTQVLLLSLFPMSARNCRWTTQADLLRFKCFPWYTRCLIRRLDLFPGLPFAIDNCRRTYIGGQVFS